MRKWMGLYDYIIELCHKEYQFGWNSVHQLRLRNGKCCIVKSCYRAIHFTLGKVMMKKTMCFLQYTDGNDSFHWIYRLNLFIYRETEHTSNVLHGNYYRPQYF